MTEAVSAENNSTTGFSISGKAVPLMCAGTPQKLSSQIDQTPFMIASVKRPLSSILSAKIS